MNRNRTWLMSVAAVAVLLTVAPAAHANLIINGGFEQPDSSAVLTVYAGSSALTGWSVNFGNVDIIEDAYWPAFEGQQSLELNGQPGAGGISQTFSTIVGQAYLLSFAYGNNPSPYGPYSATVSVSGSTNLLSETISHSTSTFADMDYSLFTRSFVADSTTTTLAFASNIPTGYYGMVLDAVSVTPVAVPEPSSLVLGSIGVVGALGRLWRRRGRQPVRGRAEPG